MCGCCGCVLWFGQTSVMIGWVLVVGECCDRVGVVGGYCVFVGGL